MLLELWVDVGTLYFACNASGDGLEEERNRCVLDVCGSTSATKNYHELRMILTRYDKANHEDREEAALCVVHQELLLVSS